MTINGTPLGPVVLRRCAIDCMREALVSSDQVRGVLATLVGRKLEAVRELVARGETPVVVHREIAVVLGQADPLAAIVTVQKRSRRRGGE